MEFGNEDQGIGGGSDQLVPFAGLALSKGNTVLIGYEVERLADGWVAVYLPGAPDTRSGSVAYFTDDRIVPLDSDLAGIASCLKTLGRGSSKIISDTARLRKNVET